MKPEAQVPSEGSLFQTSCLPSLCAACPYNSRDWGRRGWGRLSLFYIFTGSAGGSWPGSRPYYLRYSDPHNRRDRVPSLLVSLLWKVDKSLPPALRWSEQRHTTFPVSLSPLRREQPASFFKNTFYLLNTTVYFWCTFFSNSCELMAKKEKKTKKNLIYQPWVVFAWGALGLKEWVWPGHAACVLILRVATLPFCHRSVPQAWLWFFLLLFQSNQ